MSEFSLSFHIRTEDSEAAEAALKKAKISGLLLGPSSGWLTLVPYPLGDRPINPVDFAVLVAKTINAAVLQYLYAEDHCWSFAVADPEPVARFAYHWDPKPADTAELSDLSGLTAITPIERVAPFLKPGRFDQEGLPLAYGFAKTLGLPAYQWLSPDYVDRDTDHYLKRGWRRLGRKRPAPEKRLKLPEPTKIFMPNGWCTARQALQLLEPLIAEIPGNWNLYFLNALPLSDWQFRYYNPRTRDLINSYIFSNGSAGVSSFGKVPPPMTREEIGQLVEGLAKDGLSPEQLKGVAMRCENPDLSYRDLNDGWMDSDVIGRLVKGIERPQEEPEAQATMYTLSWGWSREAQWTVHCGGLVWSWTIELDAATGTILRETLGRVPSGDYVVKMFRERLAGQDWRDV